MSTCIFTYKAGGEIWQFFQLGFIAPLRTGKMIMGTMGAFVGLGTFVQIAPVVWDRLSKWGQDIDNLIAKYLFKKKYFLDEVEELLKSIRKRINQSNKVIDDLNWNIVSEKFSQAGHLKPEHEDLHCAFSKYLSEAEKEYKKVIKLLKKNDAYDNLNKERDNKADEELNRLIVQLTDSLMKVQQLINETATKN
jgi:NurA-like 5'-3' nuclease